MPDPDEDAQRRPHWDRDLHDDDYRDYLLRRRRLRPGALLLELLKLVAFLAIMIGGISWFASSVREDQELADAVYAESEQVWDTTSTVELAAMSAATTTSVSGGGGTFLGTGAYVVRTSEDQTLRYIEKREDGGFVMGSMSAENTVIYEIDDGSEPRIETQACRIVTDDPEHQAWIDEDPERRGGCRQDGTYSGYAPDRIRVHVPQGTVVDAFSVDVGQ